MDDRDLRRLSTEELRAELEGSCAAFDAHTDLMRIQRGQPTMAEHELKVQENRLRRASQRQGLRLVKSRSRDPRAIDYGLYALIDIQTNGAVNPSIAGRWVCSWTLDEVEEYLAKD